MVFLGNPSKSSQITGTLLSIQADLSNAVVWMISILPLISSSFSHFSRLFGTVPRAPITIDIIIIIIFIIALLFFYAFIIINLILLSLTKYCDDNDDNRNGNNDMKADK